MKNGRYILIAALLAALLCATTATGATGFEARAKRPSYDSGSLTLIGAGSYVSETFRPTMRVTVCLRKKFGRQSFDVRCETSTGSGRRVKAAVSVPGCVEGTWRTVVTGEAFNRKGTMVDQSVAVSRRFRC